MEMMERRIDRLKKTMKGGDKKNLAECELCEKILAVLQNGLPARSIDYTKDEFEIAKGANLLTLKPVIYAANMSEDDFRTGIDSNTHYQKVIARGKEENAEVLPICAEMEAQVSELSKEDKELFLSDLNLTESGLDRMVASCYRLLGLISYLTAGEKEVRAWTIEEGTKAPQAAGKIHSDFERGFIRAEIVSYDDLIECGSIAAAREKGLYRSEGKEYVIKDGDVVLFRFNV